MPGVSCGCAVADNSSTLPPDQCSTDSTTYLTLLTPTWLLPVRSIQPPAESDGSGGYVVSQSMAAHRCDTHTWLMYAGKVRTDRPTAQSCVRLQPQTHGKKAAQLGTDTNWSTHIMAWLLLTARHYDSIHPGPPPPPLPATLAH